MTTDRCIHRIAHNTARKSCLRVFSRACPFPPHSPLLFSIRPLHLALPAFAACSLYLAHLLQHLRLFLLGAPSPSVESLPPWRGENERAHMYARIIRAAAPRSLIVHRNRNCVFASHARPLARRPATSVSSLFVAGLNPSICAVPNGHQSSGHPRRASFDRQIACLSLYRVELS